MRARLLLIASLILMAGTALAGSPKIIKVLPHYLDLEGRHTLSPSLYERDAYQDLLRHSPEKRSSIRYDVQWTAPKKPLLMRVELRGTDIDKKPKTLAIEQNVRRHGIGSNWSSLVIPRRDFAQFQEILAWRISLWDGETLLAEQRSFLW